MFEIGDKVLLCKVGSYSGQTATVTDVYKVDTPEGPYFQYTCALACGAELYCECFQLTFAE